MELLGLWPAQLHASLPAACDTLADDPDMLELLTSELSASHVPQLINHADNADRVAAQLTSKVSVKSLIDQLSELRANLTESSDGVTTGFVGDGEGEGGEGGGGQGWAQERRRLHEGLLGAFGLVTQPDLVAHLDLGCDWHFSAPARARPRSLSSPVP